MNMPNRSGLGLYTVFAPLWIVLSAVLVAVGIAIQASGVSANPGDLLWQDETEQGTVVDIAALGGQVFAGGRAGDVVVGASLIRGYDAESGRLLWQQQIGDETATAIVVSGERVLARGQSQTSQKTTLRSYDRFTGSLLWQDEFSGQSNGKIAAVGGRVFIAGVVQNPARQSLDFFVRAYDGKAGTLLWQDAVGGSGSYTWTWAWDVAAEGSRVFAVGYGFVTPQSGLGVGPFLVRTYDARTGELLWQDQAGDIGEARRVTAAGGRVFVVGFIVSPGPRQWVVRTYDARTGSLLWEVRDNSPVEFSDVAVAGMLVFIGGSKATAFSNRDLLVRAYDADDGALVWEDRVTGVWQNFVSRVAATGNLVFTTGLHSDLSGHPGLLVRTYEARTGVVIWQDQIANTGLGGLAIAGDRLFAGGSSNITYDIHGVQQGYFLIRAYQAK